MTIALSQLALNLLNVQASLVAGTNIKNIGGVDPLGSGAVTPVFTGAVVQSKSDADYCVSARDSTWSALYIILNEVNSATRAMPSGFADIEHLFPVLSWPA